MTTECPSYIPDFFIVGAPKCGTTALYEYLKTHPDIFMPAMKEPTYFAAEFRNDRSNIGTAAAYTKQYKSRAATQIAGDASPFYLVSANAIPDILRCKPEAKIIALVRNPVEMVQSFHAQLLRSLLEDQPDLEKAWDMQAERAAHDAPLQLQYKKLCSLGSQIEKLIATVPPQQRLVLLQEDLQNNPRATYLKLLEFLGVPDDGRQDFQPVNVRRSLRSPLFQKMLRAAYYCLKPLKPAVNALGLRPFSALSTLNQTGYSQTYPLTQSFKQKLQQAFDPEIRLLEKLLARDFSHWRM